MKFKVYTNGSVISHNGKSFSVPTEILDGDYGFVKQAQSNNASVFLVDVDKFYLVGKSIKIEEFNEVFIKDNARGLTQDELDLVVDNKFLNSTYKFTGEKTEFEKFTARELIVEKIINTSETVTTIIFNEKMEDSTSLENGNEELFKFIHDDTYEEVYVDASSVKDNVLTLNHEAMEDKNGFLIVYKTGYIRNRPEASATLLRFKDGKPVRNKMSLCGVIGKDIILSEPTSTPQVPGDGVAPIGEEEQLEKSVITEQETVTENVEEQTQKVTKPEVEIDATIEDVNITFTLPKSIGKAVNLTKGVVLSNDTETLNVINLSITDKSATIVLDVAPVSPLSGVYNLAFTNKSKEVNFKLNFK